MYKLHDTPRPHTPIKSIVRDRADLILGSIDIFLESDRVAESILAIGLIIAACIAVAAVLILA